MKSDPAADLAAAYTAERDAVLAAMESLAKFAEHRLRGAAMPAVTSTTGHTTKRLCTHGRVLRPRVNKAG